MSSTAWRHALANDRIVPEVGQMDFYEQLVHFYLTAIEKCAVIPQVEILLSTAGESWTAYPNFLAIDFNNQVIQIVELTKGADAVARLGPKLKQEHWRNVEAYIKKFVQGRLNFPIVWRFVVRQKDIRSLESHPDFVAFTESGGVATAESLEDMFDTLKNTMP